MCIDQYASIARLDGSTVVAMQQERSVINNYVTIVNGSFFSDGFLNMRLFDSTQLGLSRPVRRHQDLDEHREKEDDETLP